MIFKPSAALRGTGGHPAARWYLGD